MWKPFMKAEASSHERLEDETEQFDWLFNEYLLSACYVPPSSRYWNMFLLEVLHCCP